MNKYSFEVCLELTADGDVDHLRTTANQVHIILPELIKIISDVSGVPLSAPRISLALNLYADLGLDSLDMRELILRVEDHFTVQIPEEEVMYLETISNLLTLVIKSL